MIIPSRGGVADEFRGFHRRPAASTARRLDRRRVQRPRRARSTSTRRRISTSARSTAQAVGQFFQNNHRQILSAVDRASGTAARWACEPSRRDPVLPQPGRPGLERSQEAALRHPRRRPRDRARDARAQVRPPAVGLRADLRRARHERRPGFTAASARSRCRRSPASSCSARDATRPSSTSTRPISASSAS